MAVIVAIMVPYFHIIMVMICLFYKIFALYNSYNYQYDNSGCNGDNASNACNGHIGYNGNNGCNAHKYCDGCNNKLGLSCAKLSISLSY